jgi:DNA-binding MarR family transcriptional regulator/N-acetylglutamate synthase-like GNAT family acetyltransferase
MEQAGIAARVAAVRRFSRFYTRQIGLLHEGFLGSGLSLTEGRVIYELGQRRAWHAAALAADLELDAGYLSRILKGFGENDWIERRPSETDGRQSVIYLTEAGRTVFAEIDGRSRAEVRAMLARLPEPDQGRLVQALATAERLLDGGRSEQPATFVLRPPKVGDMGWVVHRHGVLYAQEYGWDETFEALVAEIVSGFVRNFDAQRERCWIAEQDGGVVGAVFLVRDSDEVAKLRLLYVEPAARGVGIGRRLVEECVRFARETGYRRVTLWTNDVLTAARQIYQAAGFRLVKAEPHHSFGHDLMGENWELAL